MQVMSIISTKGGVGKTTTAANLAGFAADAGLRVLVLAAAIAGQLVAVAPGGIGSYEAAATAGLTSAATLLVGEGRLLGVGNVTALQVGHALAGLFSSIIWILPWSMMADIADEDELQSGTRREGALFGIFFFGQQVAAGLAVVATGLLVDQFAGLAPGVATVSAQTANRIGLLYGLLPGLLVLSAVLLVQGYRLNQPAVAAIQAALQRRAVPDSDLT